MLLWVGYGWVDLLDLFFFVKVQFHQYSTIKKVCSQLTYFSWFSFIYFKYLFKFYQKKLKKYKSYFLIIEYFSLSLSLSIL